MRGLIWEGATSPAVQRIGIPETADGTGPAGHLGAYRARDGSAGVGVAVDVSRPHVKLVVGKRGTGKSYTLGVLAESLARADGIAPVVADPMGVFGGLTAAADGTPVPAAVVEPAVRADAIPPPAWCDLLGLSPESGAGALVWQAADAAETLAGMREFVADARVADATRRAAANHLRLAGSWDVFDPAGLDGGTLCSGRATVLDLAGVDAAPANAVVGAVARSLYRTRIGDPATDRLPWLLVDEAHAFFDGIAARALRRLLTRGRGPGVSLVAATQRPAALPDVAVSQADLLVAHRLTGRPDREALSAARPAYASESLLARMPARPGEALVVDDATERVHEIRVRERDTPHRGESPRGTDGTDVS